MALHESDSELALAPLQTMIKQQQPAARFKASRPFPLHRLPSLLKRQLSVSQHAPTHSQSGQKRSAASPVSASSHVLLDLLPSVRSNAFVWTYTRLLCTSASYIAGMAFYNFIASLLSLSHDQLAVYDMLSATRPVRNHRKLAIAWLSTITMVVCVMLVVVRVVRLSEKRFAYVIHREVEKMELIEQKLRANAGGKRATTSKQVTMVEDGQQGGANGQTTNNAVTKTTPALAEDEEDDGDGDEEEDDEDTEEADDGSDMSADDSSTTAADAVLLSPARTAATVDRKTDSIAHFEETNAELAARIKSEEDRRAITRAMIAASSYQTEEDVEEEEDTEEALEAAMDAGLSAQEIAREASSQRRAVRRHDPTKHVSSSTIFFYRLCDLVCYYFIFVAVYAFQNTLQLSIHTDTLMWASGYLVVLTTVALLTVQWLERRQDSIGATLLAHEQSIGGDARSAASNKRTRLLKVKKASWRKLSSSVLTAHTHDTRQAEAGRAPSTDVTSIFHRRSESTACHQSLHHF